MSGVRTAEVGDHVRALDRCHLAELAAAVDAERPQIEEIARCSAGAEVQDRVVAVADLENEQIVVLAADQRICRVRPLALHCFQVPRDSRRLWCRSAHSRIGDGRHTACRCDEEGVREGTGRGRPVELVTV